MHPRTDHLVETLINERPAPAFALDLLSLRWPLLQQDWLEFGFAVAEKSCDPSRQAAARAEAVSPWER
jgi:hypothetical protein